MYINILKEESKICQNYNHGPYFYLTNIWGGPNNWGGWKNFEMGRQVRVVN